MEFKEWLLLSEIPHPLFPSTVSKLLPDDRNEAKLCQFDSIDMHLELYMSNAQYKKYMIEGFNAKFPFDSDYVVFNPRTFKSTIGRPNPTASMIPPNWYEYARFMDDNTTTYWAYKRIFEPTQTAVTA